MKKGIGIFTALIWITFSGFGQGYNIEIKITGYPDTTLLLAYHYGDKKFISDTLFTDGKGFTIAKGKEPLPGGVYLIVLPNMNYFEMLIDDDQKFSVEADTSDLIGSLRFKGSPENTSFLEYQRMAVRTNQENQKLGQRQKNLKDNPDSIQILKENILSNNKKTQIYLGDLEKKFPGSFLAHLIDAMTPPEMPEFNLPETLENKDSVKMIRSYMFLRDHFFDNVDFSDDRLIRTPILKNKLDQYFNRILLQIPDSIMPQIDKLANKARANDEMYQYVVIYCLNNFLESQIMGMDEVFVRVADKYYLSGKAPWTDSTYLATLTDRVNKIKPNLIGRKARDLKMETLSGEWVDLYEVHAKYIVLYFWEPNCGFCKKTTPKMYDLYKKYKDKGLEVFTVDTQDNRAEWEKYINKYGYDWINAWDPKQSSFFRYFYDVYSTPTIYLLDENKTIIAKRIDVDILGKILSRLIQSTKN